MGTVAARHQHCSHLTSPHLTMADKSEQHQQQPTMEDCSDDEEFYYNNNNNDEVNNNNNNNNSQECEDKNNNSQPRAPIFSKYGDRPLNITVTAKVLFGSVSAISALNAERKKKPS